MTATGSDALTSSVPGASRVAERLAQIVGGSAGVSTVYGAAVERDGTTVIPVARSVWGFGGGSGEDNETAGRTGSGGGGGAVVRPIGFIEITRGQARFRRIVDPAIVGGVLFAAIGLGALVARRRRSTHGSGGDRDARQQGRG